MGLICYVIVLARVPGIYGSKQTESEVRTRFVYVTINP